MALAIASAQQWIDSWRASSKQSWKSNVVEWTRFPKRRSLRRSRLMEARAQDSEDSKVATRC